MNGFSGQAVVQPQLAASNLITDVRSTRFVFVSQSAMVLLSLACAWLEAGQASVYLLTLASFVLYVGYAFLGKSMLFRSLLIFGFIAGLLELWADHFSVAGVGALVYPEGYKLLSSPLYMPLSWAIALTQLGYLAALCLNRLGLWRTSLLLGLAGSLYIPIYEHLALKAGWWYYQRCEMIWNTPYYIILFEFLVAGSLPLLLWWMRQQQSLWRVCAAGLLQGLWLYLTAVGAYYFFYFSWSELVTAGALCNALPGLQPYVNLCEYSLASIALILAGTLFWNAAYVIIIRDGFRNKFIEMPVPAAAANLAWEFVWGFLVLTSLGTGFAWGLRGWFFLDIFIVYGILRWGSKQLNTIELKQLFVPLFLAAVFLWIPVFYLFIKEGYDTSMGATSAYIITVIMELLYILFYLSAGSNQRYYAPSVAWFRLVGNAFMSLFVFLHYPQMLLLQYMCLLVFGLDVIYLMLLHRKNKHWQFLL